MNCPRCRTSYKQEETHCPLCGNENVYHIPVGGKFRLGQRVLLRFAGNIEEPGTVVATDKECFGQYSIETDREWPAGGHVYHQRYSAWHSNLRPLNDGSPVPEYVKRSVAFYRSYHGITDDPMLGGQSNLSGLEPMIGGKGKQCHQNL